MKTWEDYKQHVKSEDPEISRDIEEISKIITAMVTQRTALGLSQRELAAMCEMPQSSVARIETGKTTPNLGTIIKIFQQLGLQLNVSRSTPTV